MKVDFGGQAGTAMILTMQILMVFYIFLTLVDTPPSYEAETEDIWQIASL